MSVSSIPASSPPTPITYPDTSTTKAQDVPANADANDAGAAQPSVQPLLPPGQGTRVNQLV
jgi:hypothetical protein